MYEIRWNIDTDFTYKSNFTMHSQKDKNHIILSVIKALGEQQKFEVQKTWKGKENGTGD